MKNLSVNAAAAAAVSFIRGAAARPAAPAQWLMQRIIRLVLKKSAAWSVLCFLGLLPAAALAGGAAQAADSAVPRAAVFDLEAGVVRLNSGWDMPVVGLGTYALSDDDCIKVVTTLLDHGGRLIDTASYYGTEEAVGRAVRAHQVPREQIFVTTKLYPNEYANAAKALQGCLDRLDLGYIDLVLLHHPGQGDVEAYRVLEEAVRSGKVRSIGLSNYYISQLQQFLPRVKIMPAVVQNEIHPFYQDKEVTAFIQNLGIVVNGYSPMGGRGFTAEMFADPTLRAIADAHQVTPAQVIVRWNLQRGVVVIPGTDNPDYVVENLSVFDFELSDEEMQAIANLDRGEKHQWY